MPCPHPLRPLCRGLQAVVVLLLLTLFLQAESAPKVRVNYKQALRFSAENLRPLTHSTLVVPGWIGKSDSFWYAYRTSKGTVYWHVDPGKKAKTPLFDHDRLGSQLAELSRKPVDATSLPISRSRVSDDGARFTFVSGEMLYEYDRKAEKLVSRGKAPPQPGPGGFPFGKGRRRAEEAQVEEKRDDGDKEKDKEKEKEKSKEGDRTRGKRTFDFRAVAPDRKAVLFTRDHNLFLAESGKEKEAAPLSKDGKEDYRFYVPTAFGRTPTVSRSAWSRDSRYFYAFRLDTRNVKELWVVNSLTIPRPTLEKYSYAMPGEEAIRKSELYVGSREGKILARVEPRWQDEAYAELHWGKTPHELRFVRLDRPRRNLELCALDAASGKCRTLLREGFDNAPVDYESPRYLDDSEEMIWWSEKSGWGHFYLLDLQGKQKNAITAGPWRASRIVAVDEKNRQLYFRGNAREKGENVYHEHLYRVKLDGTELTVLDPGPGHHFSQLSPSRQFVVDSATSIDRVPHSVLRDARGNKVMDLEKTDLSGLLEYGWRMPDTFTVKAGDGVTDLYGNLWKPIDFDPKKKYPIIAHVYPGPQQEGVVHTFSAYSSNFQLAQLGFVVIQVGHRGGAPTRSKAYASFGYLNLRDYGLADKKTAIEQLAARHPWIDLGHVGIYGHSGGGFMSAAALLQKPYNTFFKAAVATAGNHDNNIYNNGWSERYHGLKEVQVTDRTKGPEEEVQRSPAAPPVKAKAPPPTKTPAAPPRAKYEIRVPTNAELAANLEGRLLLVHGELDENVHPANTMRLVDALIKANKRFDMLMLPGKRHAFGDHGPYVQRRTWEFFAEHLLGDRRGGANLLDQERE